MVAGKQICYIAEIIIYSSVAQLILGQNFNADPTHYRRSKNDKDVTDDEPPTTAPTYQNYNPFGDIRSEIFNQAMKNAAKDLPWNDEQCDVLEGLFKLQQHCLIYDGPGGTGKTAISSTMSALIAMCGFNVCIAAASNAAAAVAVLSFVKRYPELADYIIRFYPSSREPLKKGPDDENETPIEEDETEEITDLVLHVRLVKEILTLTNNASMPHVNTQCSRECYKEVLQGATPCVSVSRETTRTLVK